MFQGNYVTIKTVIEDIQRDTQYDHELNIYDVAEWAWKAMDLIGARVAMDEKEITVEINDYVGQLPFDFKSLNAVRTTDYVSMVPSPDLFFDKNKEKDIARVSSFTYKIDNKFIFTDFEEGELQVSYNAIKTDDEGFPLVPDEARYVDAVASYIIYKMDYRAYRRGSLQRNIYEESKRRWFHNVKSAFTKMVTPDVNKAELMRRQMTNMISNQAAHNSGFRTLNIETVNKKY